MKITYLNEHKLNLDNFTEKGTYPEKKPPLGGAPTYSYYLAQLMAGLRVALGWRSPKGGHLTLILPLPHVDTLAQLPAGTGANRGNGRTSTIPQNTSWVPSSVAQKLNIMAPRLVPLYKVDSR